MTLHILGASFQVVLLGGVLIWVLRILRKMRIRRQHLEKAQEHIDLGNWYTDNGMELNAQACARSAEEELARYDELL